MSATVSTHSRQPTKRWWVRWYFAGPFEYHGPWWVSGFREHPKDPEREQNILCAAVLADSEVHAMQIIQAAHDDKAAEIEWSFVNRRAGDWSPFCERFPRADWMQWPEGGR